MTEGRTNFMKPFDFLVLGEEQRQSELAKILRSYGQNVIQSETYQQGTYDAILLPVSQTARYLEENMDFLQRNQVVYGCHFPSPQKEICEGRGIRFVDYMKVEGVASKNAVATAEGAIVEALMSGRQTIQGSRVLVLGYGCCGEILAHKLSVWQADVTVAERKKEKRAKAQAYGCRAVPFGEWEQEAGEYDFIFNTVPARVVTEQSLQKVKKDVTLIDIASRPGGVDFDFCQKNNLCAKLCLGLPGKYAPKSSALILLEVIEVDFPFTL